MNFMSILCFVSISRLAHRLLLPHWSLDLSVYLSIFTICLSVHLSDFCLSWQHTNRVPLNIHVYGLLTLT